MSDITDTNQAYPVHDIVTKDGLHMVWDPTSHTWTQADDKDNDTERYNGMPESMSLENPAQDTEIPDNPRQEFGTYSAAPSGIAQGEGFESVPTDNYDDASNQNDVCPQCHAPLHGQTSCAKCMWDNSNQINTRMGPYWDRAPKVNYLTQGDNGTYGSYNKDRQGGGITDRQRDFGGSVFDQDQLAIDKMTIGPSLAANLDECPECGDVMVDRNGGKLCANPSCGHQQKIIQVEDPTTAKTAADFPEDFAGDEEYDPWNADGNVMAMCPKCGGPGVPLGSLGKRQHYRCRDCGWTYDDQQAAQAGRMAKTAAGGGMGAGAPDITGTNPYQYTQPGATDLAAGAAALAPLAIPIAGAAGLLGGGEAAAAGDAGEIAAGDAAASDVAGGAAEANQVPGRVTSLINGAKSYGKGALMYNGINGLLNAGEGLLGMGGGQGGQQLPDESGVLSSLHPTLLSWEHPIEIEASSKPKGHRDDCKCFGCQAANGTSVPSDPNLIDDDDDDDGDDHLRKEQENEVLSAHHDDGLDGHGDLSIGSGRDDGDNVVDPQTSGSREETGDNTKENFHDLADVGSANRAPYSDAQKKALEHFNNNLPHIVELAISDDDHSGDPIIQELEQMLAMAFPGHGNGSNHHDEHHQDSVEKAHDADKKEPAMASVTSARKPKMCPFHNDMVDFSLALGDPTHALQMNPSNYGSNYCKSGEFEGACNFKAAMVKQEYWDAKDAEAEERREKRQQEQNPQVWNLADDDPSELFTGEPTLELTDFEFSPEEGTFSDGAAEIHPGDAIQMATAKTAERTRTEYRDYGDGGTIQAADPNFDENGNYIPFEPTTCPNCGGQSEASHKFCPWCGTPQHHGQQQVPDVPEGNEHPGGMGTLRGGEYGYHGSKTAAPMQMHQPVHPSDGGPVSPERVIPGPDSAIDKGVPVSDEAGGQIEEGERYLLKSRDYTIPEEVTVKHIKKDWDGKPTGITFEIDLPGMNKPVIHEISMDDFKNDGASLEPIDKADPAEIQNAQQGAQPDSTPDAGEVTDLSDTPENVSHVEPSEPEYTDGLIYTDVNTGEPVSYQQYAASLQAASPPELAWLWDNVKRDVEVSERQKQMMQFTAGKNLSLGEQRELINENGNARNLANLDLSNTHYIEEDDEDPYLFGGFEY